MKTQPPYHTTNSKYVIILVHVPVVHRTNSRNPTIVLIILILRLGRGSDEVQLLRQVKIQAQDRLYDLRASCGKYNCKFRKQKKSIKHSIYIDKAKYLILIIETEKM